MKTQTCSVRPSFRARLRRDFKMNRMLYLLALPIVIYYLLFHFLPMCGIVIAFKDFQIRDGFFGSEWVGLQNFIDFFNSILFWRLIRNTLLISIYQLIFAFPIPIIFALMVNELRNQRFKKLVQTISYMPHFISMVVVAGMLTQFLSSTGFISGIVSLFTGEKANLLMNPDYFRTIYVSSGIWQQFGWKSIVYIAALSSVDTQLYEAAIMDGAGKWKQLIHVTLPAIMPTVVTLFIMDVGRIMTIGFQKTILLYNSATYEVADVISSYVYRMGLGGNFEFSYTTAIEVFGSVINLILIVIANKLSRKFSENSLW